MQIYAIAVFLLCCLSLYLWREKQRACRRLAELGAAAYDTGRADPGEPALSDFTRCAPVFFYSYRHGADGSNSMPFAGSGVSALFDLKPCDLSVSIAPLCMLILPDDLKSFIDATARSAADLSPLRIEFRTEHAEKGLLWIESRATPQLEADGSVIWHGFMHDITEQKMLQQELQRSRERLAQAQRIGQMGSWELDISSGVFSRSDEMYRIFEIEPAQCGASHGAFLDAIHAEDRVAVERVYSELQERLIPYRIEYRLISPDGRIKHVRECCTINREEDGRAIRCQGTVQDITEQKTLEQLVSRELEFRSLAENSPDVLARYDSECRFVYVNSLFEKLLGFRLRMLQGKTPLEVSGLQDAELFQLRVQGVIATGIPDEFEHPLVWPEGRIEWRQVNIVPEFDDAGKVAYAQLSSRNITSLRESRIFLAESQERLRLLLAHQEQRHEQQRLQLSWGMHENLLQILAAMHMYASMLNVGTSNTRQQAMLKGLVSGLKSSIELVREMVECLHPTVLNHGLPPALEWLADQFVARHPNMSCELEIEDAELDEKSALVIFRIVQETLAFASQYREQARMRITLRLGEEEHILTLNDEGYMYGIDLSDSRFFGLFGLQELVLERGGEMTILSAPERGLLIEARFRCVQACCA